MGREQRRRNDRFQKKLKKEVKKLTPNQTVLLEELVEERTANLIEEYKKLVEVAMIRALRTNHVSAERTKKILDQANNLMLEMIDKGEIPNEDFETKF